MKLTHFLASLIAAQGVISAPTLGKKLCTQPGWHCFKGLTNMVNIAWKPAPVEVARGDASGSAGIKRDDREVARGDASWGYGIKRDAGEVARGDASWGYGIKRTAPAEVSRGDASWGYGI